MICYLFVSGYALVTYTFSQLCFCSWGNLAYKKLHFLIVYFIYSFLINLVNLSVKFFQSIWPFFPPLWCILNFPSVILPIFPPPKISTLVYLFYNFAKGLLSSSDLSLRQQVLLCWPYLLFLFQRIVLYPTGPFNWWHSDMILCILQMPKIGKTVKKNVTSKVMTVYSQNHLLK